jgi:putative membrane protein
MRKIFFFVVVMLTPLLTMSCGPYGHMGGWEGRHTMNYGYGYGGMYMWILFLIVFAVVIYFIIKTLKKRH